jgi:hypothetical protein
MAKLRSAVTAWYGMNLTAWEKRPICYTDLQMAKNRSVKPVIPAAAQDEVKGAASEAVRTIKQILNRVNDEMAEFQKRRMQVREKIESGARKTAGRIV